MYINITVNDHNFEKRTVFFSRDSVEPEVAPEASKMHNIARTEMFGTANGVNG